MSAKIYRAWINQPSTLQPLHALHGVTCIVHDRGDPSVTLYFTEGAVHSMEAFRTCISRVYLSAAETGGVTC
jgi:hypothetical protein